MIVVKVGGSLFDLPDLGARLHAWLNTLHHRVLLFPGGGPSADVVRNWDRVHRLGQEKAHWLALRALTLNAHFLAAILPHAKVCGSMEQSSCSSHIAVLDAHSWAVEDERHPDHLPHCWDVSSDSLALRVACQARASELILLKSTHAPEGLDWTAAARAGFVDPFFPERMRHAPPDLLVRSICFRPGSSAVQESDFR